jgi:hypothetical protein
MAYETTFTQFVSSKKYIFYRDRNIVIQTEKQRTKKLYIVCVYKVDKPEKNE